MTDVNKPEEKPSLIEISGGHYQHRGAINDFLKRFETLVRDGYTLHPKPAMRQLPTLAGRPSCTMVTLERAAEILADYPKDDVVVEKKEEVVIDEQLVADIDDAVVEKVEDKQIDEDMLSIIERSTTKDQLLHAANLMGVTVPQDKKQPAAIKKYLLESLK